MRTVTHLERRALEYIRNAGGSPEVSWFDDDHDPIGKSLRGDLRRAGLIVERVDGISEKTHVDLTDLGRSEISAK